jgi:hypothetical protein
METHVKVLGVLHVATGALGLTGAAVLVIVFGGTAGVIGASHDPNAAVALPIIGLTGLALVIFVIALSLPGVVIGFGLLGLRPWARIGGIVLSIFDLIVVPFGTIVGVYGLFVLFSKDAERLFETQVAGPPA